MVNSTFQLAAARATATYPADEWHAMSMQEQSAAIYRELRILDAEAMMEAAQRVPYGGHD
jgi:hypothetical protein